MDEPPRPGRFTAYFISIRLKGSHPALGTQIHQSNVGPNEQKCARGRRILAENSPEAAPPFASLSKEGAGAHQAMSRIEQPPHWYKEKPGGHRRAWHAPSPRHPPSKSPHLTTSHPRSSKRALHPELERKRQNRGCTGSQWAGHGRSQWERLWRPLWTEAKRQKQRRGKSGKRKG